MAEPRFPPILLLPLLVIGFGVVIGFGWYSISAANVTLNLDGQLFHTHTHQSTVDGFLHEAGVWLESADVVTPARTAPIQEALTISVQRAHPVVLDINRQPRRLLTHAADPRVMLTEAGITPAAHDQLTLLPNSTSTPTDLVLTPAIALQIIDGSQIRQVYSTAPTVGEALAEAGIDLYVADNVTPALDTPVTANLTVAIERSQPVTLTVDGRTLVTRTRGTTVGAVLAEIGIALVGLDRAIPAVDQPFTPNMTLVVQRVTESEEIEQQPLPFKTVTRIDPSLPAGTQHIIQPGVDGVQEIHIRVRRENGIEVSRSAPLSWQIQPAQNEIIAVASNVTITPKP